LGLVHDRGAGAVKRWALAMLALGVLAPPAPAATSGSLTLTVNRALDARGVSVKATGKASRSGRRLRFPLTAGDAKALRTRGALQLRAAKRRVTLGAPRLELGAHPRVTARVAGRRTTILKLAVAPTSNATGVSLPRTSATLSAVAKRTLERRLKVKRLPRSFATVTAVASFGSSTPTGAQPPGAPDGPCRVSTAGGTPPTPGNGEPPVKARPATARAVTGASITWHVRDSFIRYIAAGAGTSTSRGAGAAAPEGDPPLTYAFHFPFAEGWCDPVSGAARIAFTGTVAFRYPEHAIDLVVNDPEVELDGPASRVIFRMTGSGDTAGGNRRGVVETLDVSKSTAVADGHRFSYERIPGAVPPGAASSVFAGYYLPQDPFGWVSVTFTTL
jgi:hypothetical protein